MLDLSMNRRGHYFIIIKNNNDMKGIMLIFMLLQVVFIICMIESEEGESARKDRPKDLNLIHGGLLFITLIPFLYCFNEWVLN